MNQDDEIEDELLDEDSYCSQHEVSEKDLLILAEYVLAGIGILFFLGMISELFYSDGNIFEACKTILPPIATLVIGYYFAKST